jgi:peptidyl-prolyl cis-trans isomerase C
VNATEHIEEQGMSQGRLRQWLREPIVHFIAVGFALFVASQTQPPNEAVSRIVITPQREARLATRFAMQFGAQPDAATLAQLVERDIEEEILFRRGVALGLDRDDEIVRRRIVQKMEFLLHDVNAPAEPSEAELLAFFDAHVERYATPDRATFTHVFFSAEHGEQAARRRARDALNQIAQGAEVATFGDPFPDLYHFSAYETGQVQRLFGQNELAFAVFAAPVARWMGPYRSSYGWHLLCVEARQPAAQPVLAQVRDRVRTDFLLDAQARLNDAAFNRLASEYTVVRTEL